MKFKHILIFFYVLTTSLQVHSQSNDYTSLKDISYYPLEIQSSDSYLADQCRLDIYYPNKVKNYPTVIWFHGGGLSGGKKEIPEDLKNKGMAIVGVGYRLSPKVKAPVYIEDAAAAVAWVFQNINDYGGDSSLIFISGHSAGGYLASMIGLDKQYLDAQGINADRIAGLIPLSGHTITHFTIRAENGIPGTTPVIDSYAPLFHIRKNAPPLYLITGDRDLELLGRYEENAYLMRMMKVIGHPQCELYELEGYNHSMTTPAFPLVVRIVKELSKK